MYEKPRYHGLSVFGPFLFIGLGIVLLLQQLGMMQWSIWDIAFRFWPLLIVAVGVDILVARRSFLGAVAGLVILLALLLGGIYLMGPGPARGTVISSEKVSYPLEVASSAEYNLSSGAGKIQIGPLPAASANVIEGTLGQTVSGSVTADHKLSNGKVIVSIQSNWLRAYVFSRGDEFLWNLSLARKIPLDVRLNMGAGEIIANLADMSPTSVDVKIGVGHLSLVLPSGGDLNVTISIGVGAAEISVPAGASISVECTTGVGTCNLPNGSGFWNQSYTSPGYDAAKFQIKIAISMGVGQASVTQK
ncbi:MAG TPA: DUF5668 domain-containing protein [Anaerolineales bacterium]